MFEMVDPLDVQVEIGGWELVPRMSVVPSGEESLSYTYAKEESNWSRVAKEGTADPLIF